MTYTPADAITYLVDPEALQNLVNACSGEQTRVALIGFNEYSKNVINLCPGKVVGVYDAEPWTHGVTFRGVPVVPMTERLDIDKLVSCEYSSLYQQTLLLLDLYGNGIELYYPPRIEYKSTDLIDPWIQDSFYRRLQTELADQPATMMSQEKMRVVTEMLWSGLRNPGAVVEMGVWQGGSSWWMAKLLSHLGETRPLYMLDLFETHPIDRTATMCNDQIARQMAFYPPAKMLVGYVDDEAILSQLRGQPICFAHFDLGWVPQALVFLWEHLQPGSPLLLDNYGHTGASPWHFDRFFADRGRHVIRFPWSEQGLVIR